MAAALFGSSIASGVGLKLLLCPLTSNIVIRTACCSVGVVLPVYSTFKAIEEKDRTEQERWLLYWTVYGSFSLVEVCTDKILYWFPAYYYMKFAFLLWLQFPSADGSRQLYGRHLRPFLLRHQERLDQIAEFTYSEIAKFISRHDAEIKFMGTLIGRFTMAVNQMIKDITQPGHARAARAIEGPTRQIRGSESDDDGGDGN